MKLAFEGVLFLILLVISTLMIGVPLYRLYHLAFPKKTDSLKEARIRLEVAKQDREAARLNKETEQMYSEMYSEVLEENDLEKESNRK